MLVSLLTQGAVLSNSYEGNNLKSTEVDCELEKLFRNMFDANHKWVERVAYMEMDGK